MKKVLYLFLAFALLAGKCKKDKTDDDGTQEQTYECLVKKIDYVNHNPLVGDIKEEHVVYQYDKNLIKRKIRAFTYIGDTSEISYSDINYKYYYADEDKGLLQRIDLTYNGTVYGKFIYIIQNDRYSERRLEWLNQNGGYDLTWKYTYTYDNNGKLIQERYQYFDTENNGADDVDETSVYTYTGDNVTNIKVYDTNDMNTVKEEYDFQYDQGKRAFDNVVTQTYPKTRVNNIIHMEHNVYGTNPSTEITNTAITYNNKGFPIKYEETDDRGNPVSTQDVQFDNCD